MLSLMPLPSIATERVTGSTPTHSRSLTHKLGDCWKRSTISTFETTRLCSSRLTMVPGQTTHEQQRMKNGKFVPWTKGPKIPWGSSGPLRGAKGSTWEGGIRVPGIVRWPGHVPAGKTNNAIISTLDVMPTFAALAGGADKVPTDRIVDGVDQREVFFGKSDEGARTTPSDTTMAMNFRLSESATGN